MAFLVERCGEMVASLDSHKAVPAPFLTKTYHLVDDPCTDHIVSWGEDETTFVVWRPPEFARDLLPNYFKHNNFSSFVRQLNTYGFRKIVADRWEFANEFFRKGHKHLLSEIHRRKTLASQQQHFTPPPSDLHHHYHHHHHHMNLERSTSACWMINKPPLLLPPATTSSSVDGATDYLSALSEDNQRLRRNNSLLLSELTHMKKLYNNIIYFIPHHVTPVHASSPHHAGPSSVTITEEPPAATEGSSIKLFGVALNGGGKKRLHPEAADQVYSEQREIN